MTDRDKLSDLLDLVQEQRGRLDTYRTHWAGEQPAAFLSPKSREALDGRLSRIAVNMPRLVVSSIAERTILEGFRTPGGIAPDTAAWDRWRAAGMIARSELVHIDRLNYGAAYCTVWVDGRGRPAVAADNPLTMAADVDYLTGDVSSAVRTWSNTAGSHAVVFTPAKITRWHAQGTDAPGAGAWKVVEETANPFGVVPVVPFIRRESTSDVTGTSAVADVLDLSDALGKVLQDALVTSEYFARPRRWATGLEVEEDDEGNPVDPFANDRKLVSEAPDTKFGQFEASRADGYTDLTAVFTQIIGALTGLPPHYLGLHGDQPANADGVRAAEAQLTSRGYSEMRQLDEPWGKVDGLLAAVAGQTDLSDTLSVPIWRSPEIRTPGQAADAAVKLSTVGVPLSALLADPLGYDPETAAQILADRRGEALDRAGTDLSRFMA